MKELHRIVKENNAMLKQLILYINSTNTKILSLNNAILEFIINVLANNRAK